MSGNAKDELLRKYSQEANSGVGLRIIGDEPPVDIQEGIANHYKHFDKILEAHTNDIRNSLLRKTSRQGHFFRLCMIVMIITCFLIADMLVFHIITPANSVNVEQYALAAISFLTTFIVIPKTIAKYLFNANETKQFTEVLKAIQKHDEMMHKPKDGSLFVAQTNPIPSSNKNKQQSATP